MLNKNLDESTVNLDEELVFASWDDNLVKMKSLVADGADVNAQISPGLTALHCAKLRGNHEILLWLLENGADPDIAIPDRDLITDMVFKRKADPKAPGGALIVVQNGTVVNSTCYGLANLEHGIPITSKTVFHVGSVAKQFTGFAIATLVQQGKITLEDNVREYIPELYNFDPPIKIKHLLNHTSGLRDSVGTLCLSGWNFGDVTSLDHVLTMAINQRGLNFTPGSEHLYSNTGYTLLAELVQRVTGETFRDWTNNNIFAPLEMTMSHFHDEYTELVPGKAYGYALERDGYFHALSDNMTTTGPGALYSTTEDLAKWTVNLDRHIIGAEAVYDLMFQQGVLNNGEEIAYASGLEIREYRGTKIIDHGGGWSGFTALVTYLPEYHLSIIVLYNINSDVYGTNLAVADIYLGDKLDLKPEVAEGRQKNQNVEVPEELLDRYIGTYKVFPAWYFTISREGSQLMAQETGRAKYPLSAVSQTEFPVDAWRSSIKFLPDESGQVSSFSFVGRTCPKVEQGPIPTTTPLSEEFVGDYTCAELDAKYTIAIEGDGLVVKHRRHGKGKLTPAWQDNFMCDWWFMRSVQFDRDENRRVIGLTVTQWQSRNHQFIKALDN